MVDSAKAIKTLKSRLNEIDINYWNDVESLGFKKWKNITEIDISRIFGNDNEHIKMFRNISYIPNIIKQSWPAAKDYSVEDKKAFQSGLADAEAYLNRFIHELEVYGDQDLSEHKTQQPVNIWTIASNKVFIVHGHDSAAKIELESLLREWGLNPIILHRQPDEGNTVIEKFEKHSDVGYAFVLLTPDDIGYQADQDKIHDSERKKEKRARQNVIFEFGYFVGKLERKKVCCLFTGDVQVPTDLSGFVYKTFINNVREVALDILYELQAAGFEIDLHKKTS